MIFTKRLREGVRRGQITCSIRIWTRPHVTVGNRYPMDEGEIEIDSIVPMSFADITPELARATNFKGVVDLLKVAKHGKGENVYLVSLPFRATGAREGAARRRPPLSNAARAIFSSRFESWADDRGRRWSLALSIRRVVPDITSDRMDESREFYAGFLGLQPAMDMGWIMTFVSPTNPTAQLTVVQRTQSSEPQPDVTVEVSDVDDVYKRARDRGLKIVYPLTDEPWGVRRFFVTDPNGVILNVMSHRPVASP